MVRSARTIAIGLTVPALAACATTQQKAAWVRLNSARLRASELSVKVKSPSRVVAVEQVLAVPGKTGSALVVRVQNRGPRTLTDLPISVGTVTSTGKRAYLNGEPGLDYFQTHLPAIPAHRALAWVYTTSRRVPSDVRLFAEVGAAPAPPVAVPRALPLIEVLRDRSTGSAPERGVLRVRVVNRSSVTQYQLPVYAVAPRGRSYLAAGQGTIGELAGGGSAVLRLRLVGKPATGVEIQAAPTIF